MTSNKLQKCLNNWQSLIFSVEKILRHSYCLQPVFSYIGTSCPLQLCAYFTKCTVIETWEEVWDRTVRLKEIRPPGFFYFKYRAGYHLHRVIDNIFVYHIIKLEEATTRIMSSMQGYKLKQDLTYTCCLPEHNSCNVKEYLEKESHI